MQRRSETRIGIVLSYLLLLVNTLYGLLITPYILKYIGASSYGVYKSISSLSASLAVMDLGLGATMTRYMAKYNATNDKKGACNYVAMTFVQFAIIAVIIVLLGLVAYKSVPQMYGGTFTEVEMQLAHTLVLILVLNLILRLFENLLTGIATGYEKFVVANGIKLFSIVLKLSLIIVLLPAVKNILLVVILESILVISCIVFLLWYVVAKIQIVPKLIKWDVTVFSESTLYALLMFLQSITIQFNGNVDNVLIGSILGSGSVTVYSMALVIFGMYEQLSGTVATIMLPNMTRRVVAGQTPEQLQSGVEKAGRYQFILLGAALGGFAVLGKDFYQLWLGDGFDDCYRLTLMLIVPVTIPMMQNVALAILRAQNKMLYRTATLLISCIINVSTTIIGIKMWGYWGAAVGTGIATLSNAMFMNVYYHNHLHFKIIRMFKNILSKTWILAFISAVCTWLFRRLLTLSWLSFILCATLYLCVYGMLMLLWGLKHSEKEMIQKYIRRQV